LTGRSSNPKGASVVRLNRLRLALAMSAILAAALATSAAAAPAPEAAPAPTGPTAAGVKAAVAPILAQIAEKVPTATQVFVNCPKADLIPIEAEPGEEEPIPSGRGYQCEVRYLLEGEVVKRQDEVEEEPPHSGEYVLVNISHPWKAPPTWQLCERIESPNLRGIVRTKLFLRGEVCGYFGSLPVAAIEAETYRERKSGGLVVVAMPSTFSVGDERETEVGFLTERFLCRATGKPAGRKRFRTLVNCANPFGDGIRLTMESPPPGTRLP
jgi:hypothetical protein